MSNTSTRVSQGLCYKSDSYIFCFCMGVYMLTKSVLSEVGMVVNKIRMLYVIDTDPLI